MIRELRSIPLRDLAAFLVSASCLVATVYLAFAAWGQG